MPMLPSGGPGITTTTNRPRWLPSIGGKSSPASVMAKPPTDLVLARTGERRSTFLRRPSGFQNGYQNLIFPGLWLLIGSISAIDTYLTVKFRESLVLLESNPIANLLLDLDQGDASLLIGFKFLGSIIALGILAALYLQNRRIGMMVSSGLACFQIGLLYYLLVV
jgi:hypothetical protein